MTVYKVTVFECCNCRSQESISYLIILTGNPPRCCEQPMQRVF